MNYPNEKLEKAVEKYKKWKKKLVDEFKAVSPVGSAVRWHDNDNNWLEEGYIEDIDENTCTLSVVDIHKFPHTISIDAVVYSD